MEKDIGKYIIYSDGRVWSKRAKKFVGYDEGNYRRVHFNGSSPLIHDLVAEAFIPKPEGKTEVDHIDGDGKNNDVSNLRWVTHTENMNNPITKKRKSEQMKGNQYSKGIHYKYTDEQKQARSEMVKEIWRKRKS